MSVLFARTVPRHNRIGSKVGKPLRGPSAQGLVATTRKDSYTVLSAPVYVDKSAADAAIGLIARLSEQRCMSHATASACRPINAQFTALRRRR